MIKEETKIGDYDAVIPMITGSAYLTGVATYLIDSTDPLKYGFLVGYCIFGVELDCIIIYDDRSGFI